MGTGSISELELQRSTRESSRPLRRDRDLAVYSTRKTHTRIYAHTHTYVGQLEVTHPCHSAEVKVHGLTKGTNSDCREGGGEGGERSFLTCIWPPDGL